MRPLFTRFPQLLEIPHVALCDFPSPVTQARVDGVSLWIKHDETNAPVCAGNKARSLEFLLGDVHQGDLVLTLGGEGSTHVLATATHADRLGARTIALRWRHDMNPTAIQIAEQIEAQCWRTPVYRSSIEAMLRAPWIRLRHDVRYIPLGGSTAVGVLGQVNAMLELADQISANQLPAPARIVVPLGSGGTVAGFALGAAIAGVDTTIIGVQVVPAIVANRVRVLHLVSSTAKLIERLSGTRVPRPPRQGIGIVRNAYGGAYGRPLPSANAAAQRLTAATGIMLDQTYTAKAFAVALAMARAEPGVTLFWNTFDGRMLTRVHT